MENPTQRWAGVAGFGPPEYLDAFVDDHTVDVAVTVGRSHDYDRSRRRLASAPIRGRRPV